MYNILIRPLVKDDASTSYQWRNDNEIWKYTGSRPDIIITEEIETSWIEKILEDESSKRFAIICDGEYIGNVQLTNIRETKAEFHIFIGNKDFWGKGISQLATYQILYYAKEILRLNEIYLSVKPENKAALKSYQNNNFIITGETQESVQMSIKLSELRPPMVSIFVMVYNHGVYLKECLDGLLMQKTDFDYDIVIGEDKSTDHSREILLDYQKLYPGKFKLLLHKQNIGAEKNQDQTYKNCRGKYIASCEGDDYWTDSLKLQKQIDFLENNPEYSITFHKVKEVDSAGIQENVIVNHPEKEETYDLNYLAKGNFIHTPSVVFRKNFQELPTWLLYSPIGDYPLHMLNAQFGLIKYLPAEMAVYRIGNGVWSNQNRIYRIINTMFTVKILISHFSGEKETKQILTDQYTLLMESLLSCCRQSVPASPETAAYNLSFKKLFVIIIRKLKHLIK